MDAFYHQHKRKRIYKKGGPFPHPNKFKHAYDKLIYGVAVVAPIANFPQLIKIWYGQNAEGVSLASWSIFCFGSVLWLIYGILHKEQPIIIMNFSLIIVQAFIVAGTLIYG